MREGALGKELNSLLPGDPLARQPAPPGTRLSAAPGAVLGGAGRNRTPQLVWLRSYLQFRDSSELPLVGIEGEKGSRMEHPGSSDVEDIERAVATGEGIRLGQACRLFDNSRQIG